MKGQFLALLFLASTANAKQIVLNISNKDMAIVENEVFDAEEWIRQAWDGKLNKCKRRMIESEIKQSLANGNSIPSNQDAIVDQAFARPDYLNRKQRDNIKK